jgi:YegS/Rv2252/BmrU family lipid kinase
VPLGTANDLASALQVPTEIPQAIHTALHGVTLDVDIARVNGRCFLNVSTGGFGAEATDEAPDEIKRVLGPLAYLITGAKKFASLTPRSGRFVADDEVLFEGSFLLFAVGNSRRTGGGNFLTPRADLTDGLLDLCIVREMGRVEFAALLPELRAGNHLNNPHVIYTRARSLLIDAEAALSVNADGEPVEADEYAYDISPYKLRLVVPRSTATDKNA